jgi:hypothetical protein
MFTIDGKIVLQEYDDWETWLDLMDVRSLKHRQTLCLILSEHAEGKKQVLQTLALIICNYRLSMI